MPEQSETKAGAYSGLLATIMVVALSVMAFAALEPPRERPLQTAEAVLDRPVLPSTVIAPRASER